MQLLIIFLIVITISYVALISALLFGWKRVEKFELKEVAPLNKFSIIIPFRNEAENLPDLLYSLSNLDYPRSYFEIILVNDESEDNSVQACFHFKQSHPDLVFSIINNKRNTNSPKKDAITTALASSRFEYILTTDADCIVPLKWLQAYNERIIETQASLIAGPVSFLNGRSIKEKFLNYLVAFQGLDFMSLQAVGIGAFGLKIPFMCNAANMCYKKEAFLKAEGYCGNSNISGGDDVFLLEKFTELNYPVTFLKSQAAIVKTKPQPSLETLFSQRIRWAAKAPAYKSDFAKLIGAIVLLMNLSLIFTIILVLIEVIHYQFLLFSFALKFTADLSLLYVSANFFGKKLVLSHYLWSSLLYPFFSTTVAIASLFAGFQWKGRSFKK
ncbi:cellulose synthase/poly-beta-1,6-N-acetylglucosamine synthase-like glycosyltransferase [Gillisia sp. Hel_I_86]|uniref:glycosyltransferase family 2 protein n=1 Tax=Gillisia sp. Hel_I_86 TaxID=1249981 RepID=UPI001199A84A|nr:glycosyltransferase [Gillisia sp. Hel_I_86]TVZ25811.1 cellulose synthase/poly-beta-1,6-N-acetylglucosamine synthase-like glycosyltransferase [Gillisia sp. Hel_I_86]